MSSNIQINFLSLEDMANASELDPRYEHVGIDNLGFADKEKNRVFVRAGLESELTKLLIDHELSHLFELEGTDEDEHGIRHKKKGNVLRSIAEVIGKIIPNEISKVNSVTSNIPVLGQMSQTASAADAGLTAYGDTGKITPAATSALAGYQGQSQDPGQYGSTTKNNDIWNKIGGIGNTFNQIKPLFSGSIGSGNSYGGGSGNSGSISFGQGAGGGEVQLPLSESYNSNPQMGNLMSYFLGALGQGQSAQGGFFPTAGGQSFRMPNLSLPANSNPSFSGWGEYGALPSMPSNFGASGQQNQTGVGDLSGLAKMPINPGLGQAGIALQGKSFSGMNDMFGSKNMDLTGYNMSNGGQLSF